VDNDVMRAALFVEMEDADAAKLARVEDGLAQSAIAEYPRKADSATKAFNGARLDALEATISAEGGNIPPPRPMVMTKSLPQMHLRRVSRPAAGG